MITSPQLPPRTGYVEVEADGRRTYRNVNTGMLMEDEGQCAVIAALKGQLSDTDYQIIKCYEYQMAGLDMPYDIAELHAQRHEIRDRINELKSAGN